MARKPAQALTDGEARIMSVLWRRAEAATTVADVVNALKETDQPITYSTAQTMLRILEGKGYVAHDKVVRAFVYRPVIDASQARRRAWRHLVTRLFDGSPSQLVLNMLDDDAIDPAELQQLKKLIEQA